MTHLVTFTVDGPPPIARRVRAVRRGAGIHVHQTDETDADEQRVAVAAQRTGVLLPVDVPLRMDVLAVFRRPKSRPKIVPREVWQTGRRVARPARPDRDNVDKAGMDGCQRVARFAKRAMLVDDGQVCGGEIKKVWAAKGEEPHTVITVSLMPWLDDEGLTGQALASHAVVEGATDGATRRRRRGTPMSPNGTPPGGP